MKPISPKAANITIALAAFALAVFFFISGYSLSSRSDGIFVSALDPDSPEFSSGWHYDNGDAVAISVGEVPYMKLDMPDCSATITKTVTERTFDETYMCFRVKASCISIKLNGEEIYRYENDLTRKNPINPYSMHFFTIPLPPLDVGDNFSLYFETENETQVPLQYMSVGCIDEVYVYIQTEQAVTVVICILLGVLALFQFSLSAVHLALHSISIQRVYVWLAVFIALSITWIGTDSGLFVLLFRNYAVYYAAQYLSLMLLPAAAIMYLSYCGSKRQSIAPVFCAINIGASAVCFVLYYFGITDLEQTLPVFHALMAIVYIYMFIKLVCADVEKNIFYIAGLVVMLAACTASLIAHYIRFVFPTSQIFKYGMLIFVICMLIYILMDIGRLLKLEKKTAVIEAQKKMYENELFLTQISSHFFYNTMNIIRGLIKINPDRAYDVTGNFVKYMRSHVDAINSKGGIISFSKELESVKAYIEVSKVKMNDALTVEYDVETTDFEVPALTLEPLVENAIRHGLFPRGEGNIKVTVRERENGYSVTIADNGVGFEKLNEGVGISNVRQRLSRFNGCSLKIESVPGTGTVAEIIYAKGFKEDNENEDDNG